MIVVNGDIYLDEGHAEVLRSEPEYVKKRYFAVAKTLAPPPFRIVREKAAELIGRSVRQMQRIVKQFKLEGIVGLRFKSKRPKTSPNKTSREVEEKILAVRKATGFGPKPTSDIVNHALDDTENRKRVYPSLTYNILVRNGEIERERRIQKEWRRFEWGHPNRLIQADLTPFNGVPIMTMLDDHSRKGWSKATKKQNDKTVTKTMRELVPVKYDNLLTDNGSQFSRKNAEIRKYCQECINEKHIWTSIHHPETMGKLSAYQKALKHFLTHRLGNSRDIDQININIDIYDLWNNNGRVNSTTGMIPEERYSGNIDAGWFQKLIKALKLEELITPPQAQG